MAEVDCQSIAIIEQHDVRKIVYQRIELPNCNLQNEVPRRKQCQLGNINEAAVTNADVNGNVIRSGISDNNLSALMSATASASGSSVEPKFVPLPGMLVMKFG